MPDAHEICGDDARRLFFDRVGQYFVVNPVAAFDAPKPCSLCGEMLTHGFEKGGIVSCAASRSITEKRDPAVADPSRERKPKMRKNGAPAAPRGYNAFNDDRRLVLITPSASFVAANVKPQRPLPNSMTFLPSGDDAALGELYRKAFSGEIETPVLFIAFQRNAGAPFVMTESADAVVISGGTVPVCVDVKRIQFILALASEVGVETLHRTAVLRRRIAHPGIDDDANDNLEFNDLLREHPALRRARDTLPTSANETEYEIARKLLKTMVNEAKGLCD